jgi:hypothetical protein
MLNSEIKALQATVDKLTLEKRQHLPSSREAIRLSDKIRAYEAVMNLPGFIVYATQQKAA